MMHKKDLPFDLLRHPYILGMCSEILPTVQTYWQFIFNSASCYRFPAHHVILCFIHANIPQHDENAN